MNQESKMNGLDKAAKSRREEAGAPDSHYMNSNGHNDCNNLFSNGSSGAASTSYGGARPKTREFDGNIPNRLQQRHQAIQNDSNTPWRVNMQSSTERLCVNQNNLSRNSEEQKPSLEKHDIECQSGPSQPFPDECFDNGESDASRLAAVCAASSRRAIAERARRAEQLAEQVKRIPRDDSDSSSDTGNDDGLSGDECCIYTYKGDQNADLSNGLLGLSLPPTNEHPAPNPPHPVNDVHRNGGSSPEMDYLEMDFDPDPLGEQDSVEEDNLQMNPLNSLDEPDRVSPSPSVEEVSNDLSAPALSRSSSSSEEGGAGAGANFLSDCDSDSSGSEDDIHMPMPLHHLPEPDPYLGVNVGASTSGESISKLVLPKVNTNVSKEILRGQHIAGSQLCPVDMDLDDAQKISFVSTVRSWHGNNEPVLDKQKFNLYSALYHSIMANNLILDEEESENARMNEEESSSENGASGSECCPQKKLRHQDASSRLPLEKTMIWTEKEACHKQVSQIAVSACGAAAVSNVLSALNIPYSLEEVHEGVATRLRAEKGCLPTYLFSRAAAGAAHSDLIRGLEIASEGSVYSRFFHMYPERSFSLAGWLAHWIKAGVVPIATLNIQRSLNQGSTIPDSWHHQMIFGVSQRGVYLTNPLECVSEEALHPQLCSPSELLVRRQDIVAHWHPSTDLCRLATSSDIRWKQMNVLGQVVNVLREANARPSHYLFRRTLTSHITIPASYCSGILLSGRKDSPGAEELRNAPELPLKSFMY